MVLQVDYLDHTGDPGYLILAVLFGIIIIGLILIMGRDK